jgi:hypothetical protein
MPTKDPTAAARQRRYRHRRRHDLLLAQAEVPATLAERLIDAGLLAEEAAADPHALGEALVAAAKRPMHSG